MGRTLAEKVWDDHVVRRAEGEPDLLFIDLHLLHEVTSPQAFDGLRQNGRQVRRLDLTIATEDHNTPTLDIDKPIADPVSRAQLETLRKNCAEFGVRLHPLGDVEQGVVHVVGPQLGLTQPGTTVVCGDSHTSTHGAFGALAFGIGTSQVEHVLATQTLPLARPRTMAITIDGELPEDVTAKDLILAIITKIGTGGGQGYILEYRGSAIEKLSMESRMTICNMSIEAGRPRGHDRPRRDHLRLSEGPCPRPRGRGLGRGRRVLEDPQVRRGRGLRRRGRHRRRLARAVRHLGHQPRPGRAAFGERPRPGFVRRRFGAPGRRKGPGVHGVDHRPAAARHQGRHRLRRLLHQRPHRGPAQRRRPAGGPQGRRRRPHAGRPRLGARRPAGRRGGSGQGLQGVRRRMAARGLLDVPGHEPRPTGSR